MSPERLLKHFEQISEAPDAVQQLRRFILDLAVRGKLVKQNAKDEPVGLLVAQIQTERARRAKSGDSIYPQASVESAEGKFLIPPSWKWVRLGFVTKVIMGQSPPGVTYNTLGEGDPLINGPVEFSEGAFGTTALNQYTTAPTKRCKKGDLLLCVRGSTTGRTNVAGFDACIGRGVAALQPLYEDKFIRLFVWASREQIIEMGRGIAFPSVSRQQIEDLPTPLPPLAEQLRIVAKVDELMALCDKFDAAQAKREKRRDRLVAAALHALNNGDASPAPGTRPTFKDSAGFYLNHLPRLTTRPEHIHQLRQTILNLAVSGKLVKQNPSDEPAFELLKKIEKAKGGLIKIGRARKTHLFQKTNNSESPFELPEKWQWISLMDLGVTQTGNTPSKNNPEYFGTYISFVKPADLTGVEINYAGEGISQEGLAYARLIPKGSVLMVCIGSSIGKVNRTARDICCNQQINTITPFVAECGSFIALSLKASFFQRMILDQAGAGTLPIISKGKWEQLPVPMPPLSEQQRIVAKVDGLMALCNKLESRLTTNATTRHQLLEATLKEGLVL